LTRHSSIVDSGYATCDDEFTRSPAMKSAGIGELVYATDCPGLALRNLTAANSGGDAISVSASPAA